MVIKRSIAGLDVDETQARIESLLIELGQNPDNAEAEAEVIKLYEKLSDYRDGCGLCVAGRNLFINGIRDVKNGQPLEGLANFKGALRSVNLKWASFANKLGL